MQGRKTNLILNMTYALQPLSIINQICVGLKEETLLGEYILTGCQNTSAISFRNSYYRHKCHFCGDLNLLDITWVIRSSACRKVENIGSIASKTNWGDKCGKSLPAIGKRKWECQCLSDRLFYSSLADNPISISGKEKQVESYKNTKVTANFLSDILSKSS